MEFESTTPVFEGMKIFHALDRSDPAIGWDIYCSKITEGLFVFSNNKTTKESHNLNLLMLEVSAVWLLRGPERLTASCWWTVLCGDICEILDLDWNNIQHGVSKAKIKSLPYVRDRQFAFRHTLFMQAVLGRNFRNWQEQEIPPNLMKTKPYELLYAEFPQWGFCSWRVVYVTSKLLSLRNIIPRTTFRARIIDACINVLALKCSKYCSSSLVNFIVRFWNPK
jgi:hypothetical protein